MANDFEQKYFRQPGYWIAELELNLLRSEITLSLIANPDTKEVDGVIKFTQISEYDGEFNLSEDDPLCLDMLIGICCTDSPKGKNYCINFSVGEISFISQKEPSVEWRAPNKGHLYLLHKERINR
ncbi:hypothetical protein ACFOEK_18100 [Litoribrevibacter euphylliae]|uniref:Uncharacterized protein n=1 Tax=Litoribrevibacter euphylliae TaxID=1834034 RepID=A0ABV7HGJ3_9GAMM